MKKMIEYSIEQCKDELVSLSKKIHEKPELAFQEYAAVENITSLLIKHGFTVEKGVGGLETAFRAEYRINGHGPTLAFIAEYDEIGRAHV